MGFPSHSRCELEADPPTTRMEDHSRCPLGFGYASRLFHPLHHRPALQKWSPITRPGESPYRLYALSNVGSLLGLLSYPFLAEWMFTIHQQSWIWSFAYAGFVVLCAAIAWRFPDTSAQPLASSAVRAEASAAHGQPPPKLRSYLFWIALSTCSSVMLLATTNRLCEDVAVIPLLWVLPLSLYLLSFVITFDSDRFYRRRVFGPVLFLALGLALRASFLGASDHVSIQIGIYCLALLAVCMVCHGELARSRPAPSYLTSFYFMIAGGGVLGGIFVVIIAPQIFRGFWEFEIALFVCGCLLLVAAWSDARRTPAERWPWAISAAALFTFLMPRLSPFLPPQFRYHVLAKEYFAAILAAACVLIWTLAQRRNRSAASAPPVFTSWPYAIAATLLAAFAFVTWLRTQSEMRASLFQGRNFFGVTYVLNAPDFILLKSGTTVHGLELKDRAQRDNPTIYYRHASGIGLLLTNFPRPVGREGIRLGVVGMGAGTLAAYAQSSDNLRYYEIDPAVIQLSQGPQPYFHFVEDSPSRIDVVLGDARLSLERELAEGRSHDFDVLVIDAFSGDAIPVHLLTREAMQIYLQRLAQPNGVIAIHISNEYLDLAPVLAGLRDAYQLHAVEVQDARSLWILLSKNPEMFHLPNLADRAQPITLKKSPILWTDNYSNLFQILR